MGYPRFSEKERNGIISATLQGGFLFLPVFDKMKKYGKESYFFGGGTGYEVSAIIKGGA